MLIYARKTEPSTVDASNLANNSTLLVGANSGGKETTSLATSSTIPVPPQRARDIVNALNAAHEGACRKFVSR